MSTTTQTRHDDGAEPDLRLPDHRRDPEAAIPTPARLLGVLGGIVGGGIVAVIYLVGAPFVALATGLAHILMDVRENAVRPRPFVGARHGFPFLDPSPVPVATEPPIEDTRTDS